ncbi:hypothetical protein [Mesorhizobium sp. IMUNJ 23232]|uniref:hypothetical protein n=1 Tax=Mesorhizobium sp. IMUNJ 23232 TaxID=3376064 RepID=UPI0037A2C1C5
MQKEKRERAAKEKQRRERREFELARGKDDVAQEHARVGLAELLIERLGADVDKAAQLLRESHADSVELAHRITGSLWGRHIRFGSPEPRTEE